MVAKENTKETQWLFTGNPFGVNGNNIILRWQNYTEILEQNLKNNL